MGVGDLSELYMSKEKVKLKPKCNCKIGRRRLCCSGCFVGKILEVTGVVNTVKGQKEAEGWM